MGLNNRKENRKMEQTIQLSDHFGYRRLIRFTIPSILMMIFTSIYGVVDGFFVSNFVGKTSFAAVNFIMPFLMITGVMGFMFGTGGSALIAKIMGEGKKEKAQKIADYIDKEGAYPFAIDIPILNFISVTEKKSIDTEYPNFKAWADSKGEKYTDWYNNHVN